jgi:hypothetical protein
MANQFQLSRIIRVTLVANSEDSILEGCQKLLAKKGDSRLDTTTLIPS